MAGAIQRAHARQVPPVLLRGAAILVIGAIVLIGAARLTGVPPAALPPLSAPAVERSIAIVRDGAGGVRVSDAATGRLIAALDMESAGFIGGVDRALARERMKHGLDPALPVRLVRWQDGRLSLLDPATGWRAELVGFGPDNQKAFARLLDSPAHQQGRQSDPQNGDRQ